MERGNQNWLYNCEYVMEVPKPKNDVPHFLPGKNPFMKEFANKFGLPFESRVCRSGGHIPRVHDETRRWIRSSGVPQRF